MGPVSMSGEPNFGQIPCPFTGRRCCRCPYALTNHQSLSAGRAERAPMPCRRMPAARARQPMHRAVAHALATRAAGRCTAHRSGCGVVVIRADLICLSWAIMTTYGAMMRRCAARPVRFRSSPLVAGHIELRFQGGSELLRAGKIRLTWARLDGASSSVSRAFDPVTRGRVSNVARARARRKFAWRMNVQFVLRNGRGINIHAHPFEDATDLVISCPRAVQVWQLLGLHPPPEHQPFVGYSHPA